MITEDYVSFETAKLLKEKGFNEHCFCVNYPLPEGGHHNIILPDLLNNSIIPFIDEYKFCRYKEDFITIPTLQMAMKWLREVYGLHVWVDYSRFDFNKEHPYLWNIVETKIDGDYWTIVGFPLNLVFRELKNIPKKLLKKQ